MKLAERLITIREPSLEDTSFILNSWLKSFRNSFFARVCPNDIYYKFQAEIIKWCLENHEVKVLCVKEDEYQIVGYIVYGYIDQEIVNIDYLYVKQTFRRMGIAERLIEEMKFSSPAKYYWCDVVSEMSHKLSTVFRYTVNPYAFMEKFNVFKSG